MLQLAVGNSGLVKRRATRLAVGRKKARIVVDNDREKDTGTGKAKAYTMAYASASGVWRQ